MSFYRPIYDCLRGTVNEPRRTALVLQSRAAGRRLLAALAVHCGPLLGAEAETPFSLAAEVCGERLGGKGAPRLMNDDEAAELLLECVLRAQGTFSGTNAGSLPAARELYRNLLELELEDIPPLTRPGKQADLQALREAYAAKKRKENCLDRGDLFTLALEEAPSKPKRRVVTFPTQRFSARERALLEALAQEGRVETVPLPAPMGCPLPGLGEAGLVWADPLEKRTPRNTRLVNCMGMEVEVEQVFRDILEKGYPLETCAVVYGSGSYTSLLYEAAGRWGAPVSMSSGIPMEQTRLSAALRLLTDLHRRFFDAELIRRLLTQLGCLSTAEGYMSKAERREKGLVFAGGKHLAANLLSYRVGWGDRNQYLGFLPVFRKDLEKLKDEDRKQDYLAKSEIWEKWLEDVFCLAEGKADLESQKNAMLRFLASCSHVEAAERAAVSAAVEAVRHVRSIPTGERLADWLSSLLQGRSIMAENAVPGKLFCLPLSQGRLACREHVYVLGLGHDAFSDSRESAVLLDGERQALSPALRLGRNAGREKLARFGELLLWHEGELILSYPGYDADRHMTLECARLLARLRDERHCPVTVRGYLPEAPRTAADELLLEEHTRRKALPDPNPGQAKPAALSPEKPFGDWMREREFSPSAIESALRCPLSFYLPYVLGVRKQESPKWQANRWLESNKRGTLVHSVLENYYAALRAEPNLAPRDREALLDREFDRCWADTLKRNPPPPFQAVQEEEKALMQRMIRSAVEWTTAQDRTVLRTEQKFGKGEGLPVTLDLGSRKLRLMGTIDRVDLCTDKDTGEQHYAILDYKTGSTRRHEEQAEYHVQHYLYAEAERLLSAGEIDPMEAGYLMLADEEVAYFSADEAACSRAKQAVTAMLERLEQEDTAMTPLPWVVKDGVLVDLDAEGQQEAVKGCRSYCDYRGLCPLITKAGNGGNG